MIHLILVVGFMLLVLLFKGSLITIPLCILQLLIVIDQYHLVFKYNGDISKTYVGKLFRLK